MVCFSAQEIGLNFETLQKGGIGGLNLAENLRNGFPLSRVGKAEEHREKIRAEEKQKPEEKLLAERSEHALGEGAESLHLTVAVGLNLRFDPHEIAVNPIGHATVVHVVAWPWTESWCHQARRQRFRLGGCAGIPLRKGWRDT